MHKSSVGRPSPRGMQPCLHTSRDRELTTSQDGCLLSWGALFSWRLRPPLCQGLSLCFSYHSCFYCNPFPLQTCLLIDFPYRLPFSSSCASLPVSPAPLPPRCSTAEACGLPHSPLPEPFLRGLTRSGPAATKLTLPWGHCRTCGPTIHTVPMRVRCQERGMFPNRKTAGLCPGMNTERARGSHPQLCTQMTSLLWASVSLSRKWV